MGTHPIFESDFDCLTVWMDKENLKVAGAVVGGAVLGAAALPVALPLLGFSSSGVVAGTAAASAQSYVYGAFTTGVFSAAQSAGIAGVSSTVTGVMATAGGVAGGLLANKQKTPVKSDPPSLSNRLSESFSNLFKR